MATLFGRKIMEDDSHFWPKNKNVIFAVLGVKNKKMKFSTFLIKSLVVLLLRMFF